MCCVRLFGKLNMKDCLINRVEINMALFADLDNLNSTTSSKNSCQLISGKPSTQCYNMNYLYIPITLKVRLHCWLINENRCETDRDQQEYS